MMRSLTSTFPFSCSSTAATTGSSSADKDDLEAGFICSPACHILQPTSHRIACIHANFSDEPDSSATGLRYLVVEDKDREDDRWIRSSGCLAACFCLYTTVSTEW